MSDTEQIATNLNLEQQSVAREFRLERKPSHESRGCKKLHAKICSAL